MDPLQIVRSTAEAAFGTRARARHHRATGGS